MPVVEAEGSGSKVPLAGLALKYAELPVKMANEMKSFFDEESFVFTVLIRAMSGCEMHEASTSKRCDGAGLWFN